MHANAAKKKKKRSVAEVKIHQNATNECKKSKCVEGGPSDLLYHVWTCIVWSLDASLSDVSPTYSRFNSLASLILKVYANTAYCQH